MQISKAHVLVCLHQCKEFFGWFPWCLSHMPLHMQCQVIRPGEGALAQVALEGTVSGVFTEVARQLIGPGKLPATTLPAAVVWLLT